MRRETRISCYGSGVTGCARTRAPARERRGALGSLQATEPGCGAEPHVSRHEPSAHRDGGNGCIIGGTAAGTEVAHILALTSPYVSLTGGPTSTVNCRHELDPRGSRSGARLLDFDDWGLTPAAAPGGDT